MRHLLFSFLCLLFCGSAFSQSRVIDFASAMTSAPIGKKILVMDVNYEGNSFCGVEERLDRWRRPWKSTRDRYTAMGCIIDSLNLIDYSADTVYVYSNLYLPTLSVSESFKVRNNHFSLFKNTAGEYSIRYIEYNSNAYPNEIISESLFFGTVFSWDIDKIIQMIKDLNGFYISDNVIYATRIIIRDNRVVEKEIIYISQLV